jgi:hypothetical protein
MDLPSHVAAAAIGIVAGTTLSQTTNPLVATIGAWASFGAAAGCAFEAMRERPRWDRAAGYGTAGGAAVGGLVLLQDIVTAW